MEKVRSFLSLNIDSYLTTALTVVQERVKNQLDKYNVKWEKPDNFHLTIRFLGDFGLDSIEKLKSRLDTINLSFSSINLTTKGIGFFPNTRFPNVVFIDLKGKQDNCDELVERIDEVLKEFNIKPDKKFVPHITLGRFRQEHKVKLAKEINIDVEEVEVKFDSFYLIKSQLTPKGSIYSVIKEFKFNKEK